MILKLSFEKIEDERGLESDICFSFFFSVKFIHKKMVIYLTLHRLQNYT